MKRAIKVKGKIRMMTFEEVYEQYIPLLHNRTKRYRNHTLYDDIFQVARIALWKSFKAYERPDCEFVTFAYNGINQEIYNYIRDYYKLLRKVSENDIDTISLYQQYDSRISDNTFVKDMIPDDYNLEKDMQLYFKARDILLSATKTQQKILLMIAEGYTHKEISQKLGMSRQWVSEQLRRLRSQFRKEGKCEAMH